VRQSASATLSLAESRNLAGTGPMSPNIGISMGGAAGARVAEPSGSTVQTLIQLGRQLNRHAEAVHVVQHGVGSGWDDAKVLRLYCISQ
jgi:hypothetical protein